jgi:hypothetical protein
MNPLALEWASILLALIPQMLGDAYSACGLPCFVTTANQLQLSAPLLDLIYQLPDGTASAFLRANGFSVRGM